MTFMPDPLQALVLDQCRDWSNRFVGIRAVYVFGSVGRGDYQSRSDIDLYFDIATSDPAEFQRSLAGLESFRIELSNETGRTVSVHYDPFDEQADDASKAVKGPDSIILTTREKVRLVSAPKATRRETS
jgi:predicted nucleotidyltransferase